MSDESVGGALMVAFFGALGGLGSGWLTAIITERRTSRVKRVDAATDLVEEIRVSACSYWEKSGRDTASEALLKLLLERLDTKIDGLFPADAGRTFAAASGAESLWREITGGTFETDTRLADLGVAKRIRAKSRDLVSVIRS